MTSVETTTEASRSGSLLPVGLGLLLGLLGNYFFFNRPLGISVLLFALAGLLALYGLAAAWGMRADWRSGGLAVMLAFLSGMAVLRAQTFTTFLNLSAALLLTMLLAHNFRRFTLLRSGFPDYLSTLIISGIEILVIKPIDALVEAGKAPLDRGGFSPKAAAVFRGLALAAPVVLVFTVLFSSADAAFNLLVKDVLAWLRLDNIPELIARLVFSLAVAWGIVGGLAYALRREKVDGEQPAKKVAAPLGFTEAAVILGSVNLLFAAFVAVQFRYFFGGQSNIHFAGLTYAEYTRRGFAELILVAIFSLGLALLLQRLTDRRSPRAAVGFEALAALLVALTGVILVSAFQRLLLYEQAYGFTQLRTYVHVFMSWVGVLLLVFLASLHFDRPRWFAMGMLLAFLGFIITLDVLNTDAFIVRQNLTRYTATGKLDAEYLATLSDDAIPGLLEAMPQVGPEEQAILGSALHYRLDELGEVVVVAGWPGWHWSRSRAYTVLTESADDLEEYPPKKYEWRFPID